MAENSEDLLVAALAPMIVGALIAACAAYYWRRGRELRANGVATQATVIAKRPATGPLGDYNEFTVQFVDAAGNPRVATVKERKMRSSMVGKGTQLAITYLPAKPDTVEIGYRWGKKLEGWVVVVFGMGGLWMVVYGLGLLAGVF